MNEIISAGVDIGLIVGLTQVIKMLGLPKRYIPTLAILVGVCLSFISVGVSGISAIAGIIAGLVSVGMYSGVRATAGK